MTLEDARHFLARTGFGPTMAELKAYEKLKPAQRAQLALKGTQTKPTQAPPEWTKEEPFFVQQRKMRAELMAMKEADRQKKRQALRKIVKQRGLELAFWWYDEMIHTKSPLTERMVLFWHNHFTSSAQKVKSPGLMYKQNQLFRQHATGNFGTLLLAIAQDPAMIVYLDNQTNRKAKPNENFARELLELFTLGEGHYTERDIKEAARAFSGWHMDLHTGNFQFNRRQHDDGQKSFMGKTGKLGGEDVIARILEQPRLAEHIVERLWLEFISDTPIPAEVKRLAKLFRGASYELKPLLQAMWTSPAFLDPEQRGAQIKSPIELIVGTIRLFEVPLTNKRLIVQAGRTLGHTPFMPPSVKGWPRGTDWITSDTLATRQQLIHRVFRDEENLQILDTKGLAGLIGPHKPKQANKLSATLLLPIEPVYPIPEDVDAFELLRHLVLDPAYQLK